MDPLAHARRLLEQGQLGPADRLVRRVVAARPADAEAWGLLAGIAERRGDLDGALRGWMRAAQAAAQAPGPMLQLGRILAAAGKRVEASGAFEEAARRAPADAALRGTVADALAQLGQADAALQHLQRQAALSPADPAPLARAAELLAARGALPDAIAHLELALRRDPDLAPAWTSLAWQRSKLGDVDGALAAIAEAEARAPDAGEPREMGGRVALKAGRMADARRRFSASLHREPGRPGALWGRAAAVPVLADSADHERAIIEQYRADLAATAAAWSDAAPLAPWLDAVQTAFPRHYHGGDCLDEQRQHGALLARVVGRLTGPATHRPSAPGGRIRVAFCSSYLYEHTVTKLFRGWMEELDRGRFTVTGVSLNHRDDAVTAALQQSLDGWVDARGSLQRSIAALRSTRPDVVIFPELGMDPATLRLAAARHAPVQLVAWGHPVSPGLPTIDGFLSSAGMAVAPDRAWTHAPRHDLPGLSIHYRRPAPPEGPLDRAALGLPDDRLLCLSVQTLAKFRPWTDDLHARIAAGAPDAVLVFVADHRPAVTAAFRARLGAVFHRHGLDLDAHVRIVRRLTGAEWMQLMAAGDLFLDGMGWSGGNTSLEALATGLPCLAFPGETMRGRHTLAMVRALELPALEARDADDFVGRAVALLGDPVGRARLREQICARVDALYADRRGVRALEALLTERVSAARRG